MNGQQVVLSNKEINLLPTGKELIERDKRENNQLGSLIELNDGNSIYRLILLFFIETIYQCPSLPELLHYKYTGDEMHKAFKTELDSFSVDSFMNDYL